MVLIKLEEEFITRGRGEVQHYSCYRLLLMATWPIGRIYKYYVHARLDPAVMCSTPYKQPAPAIFPWILSIPRRRARDNKVKRSDQISTLPAKHPRQAWWYLVRVSHEKNSD
jgi:hypothetical protein